MSYAALLALAALGGGHGCSGGEVVNVNSCYGSCYSSCYGSCYGGCYGETQRHRGPIRAVLGAIFGGRNDPCEVVHSCYGGCYGSCYGSCYGTTHEVAKPVVNPDLAPAPDEEIPIPEAESTPEATPQARRTVPAQRIVRRDITRRYAVVSEKPVRRSTRVAQPTKTAGRLKQKTQVARARVAKAATQARTVAARHVAKRKTVVAAKPVAKPNAAKVVTETPKPARVSKPVATARLRRDARSTAWWAQPTLREKSVPKSNRNVSPPVVKQTAATSPVQSRTPRVAKAPVEERKETARKSQPKTTMGLAWYQLTKQTAVDPGIASPIR